MPCARAVCFNFIYKIVLMQVIGVGLSRGFEKRIRGERKTGRTIPRYRRPVVHRLPGVRGFTPTVLLLAATCPFWAVGLCKSSGFHPHCARPRAVVRHCRRFGSDRFVRTVTHVARCRTGSAWARGSRTHGPAQSGGSYPDHRAPCPLVEAHSPEFPSGPLFGSWFRTASPDPSPKQRSPI